MPPRQGPQQPVSLAQNSQSITSNVVVGGQKSETQSRINRPNSSAQEPNNLEQEFTQRFLSLFTSFYESPSIEEITTFPSVPGPNGDPKPQGRTPPFHSGVWDLRLKKAIEARITNDQLTSDSLSEQVLQLRETLAAETPDLNDVFEPQKTERPQIPLYLQNIQKDENETKAAVSKRVRPLSSQIAEYTQLFSERLKRQKEMSKDRKKRRFMRAKELEKQHMDFVKTLHRSKLPDDYVNMRTTAQAKFKVLQEQREKQLEEGRRAVESMRAKSPVKQPQQEYLISLK